MQIIRRGWPLRMSWREPFADLDQMRREMSRLFDSLAGEFFEEPGAGVFPPMNLTQDNDNFYVRTELPGVKAQDIEVSAVRNRLTLAGKRELAAEAEGASCHRRERTEGTFNRVVSLPGDFDTQNVNAHYADGILTVTLPKTEAAKPRQIAVKTA